MIVKRKDLNSTLFIDIETVSEHPDLELVKDEMQQHWKRKSDRMHNPEELDYSKHAASMYKLKAGIFSEFSKIVCITVGYLSKEKNEQKYKLKVKSFAGHNEVKILEDFSQLLDRHFDRTDKHYLCGHNIKEFDIPFLCRRLVINRLHLPRLLNISGKKPWQVTHLIDTLELWKFGDYKNYTSLALLAETLGISSPKDDIDGSQVGEVYWEDDDLDRIVLYCEKDVITVAQIAMRFAGADLIDEIEIIHETMKKRPANPDSP